MLDALAGIIEAVKPDAVIAAIILHGDNAIAGWRKGVGGAPRHGGDAVIDDAEGQVAVADGKIELAQTFERYPAATFLDDVAVDMHDGPAIAQVLDNVLRPDFFEQGSRVSRHLLAGLANGEAGARRPDELNRDSGKK